MKWAVVWTTVVLTVVFSYLSDWLGLDDYVATYTWGIETDEIEKTKKGISLKVTLWPVAGKFDEKSRSS